jgi:hypothetical protein
LQDLIPASSGYFDPGAIRSLYESLNGYPHLPFIAVAMNSPILIFNELVYQFSYCQIPGHHKLITMAIHPQSPEHLAGKTKDTYRIPMLSDIEKNLDTMRERGEFITKSDIFGGAHGSF